MVTIGTIGTICPISTIGTTAFQSNLKVSESSINVIFIVLILIRLGNIGLKTGLELKNRKNPVKITNSGRTFYLNYVNLRMYYILLKREQHFSK